MWIGGPDIRPEKFAPADRIFESTVSVIIRGAPVGGAVSPGRSAYENTGYRVREAQNPLSRTFAGGRIPSTLQPFSNPRGDERRTILPEGDAGYNSEYE
jgi:hypothetical protein